MWNSDDYDSNANDPEDRMHYIDSIEPLYDFEEEWYDKPWQKNRGPWTLTICPTSDWFELDIRQAYFILRRKIIRILRRCCEKFVIYPEIRHPQGSIHFHGIMLWKDPIKWYKQSKRLLRKIGYIDSGPVKDFGWHQYCKKEVDFMRELLERDDIAFTETDRVERASVVNIKGPDIMDITSWFKA